MADMLIKMKTGTISRMLQEQNGQPAVSLDKGSVYFAVDTTTHKGKIIYDAPLDPIGVDRIVMSTDAESAEKDASGNVITSTYATKAELNSYLPEDIFIDKGILSSPSNLPLTYEQGWVYKIGGNGGIYAGKVCKPGDLLISKITNPYVADAENSHWISISTNIDPSTYMVKGIDYVTAGLLTGATIGTKATAEGVDTQPIGNYSHAEGNGTTASAASSHAEGASTIASGANSHAEGYTTVASGEGAHAEGYHELATSTMTIKDITYTIGALGKGSHVEGIDTSAGSGTTDAGHAEGGQTVANGSYAHAEGYQSIASGWATHAEGNKTIASGYASHAEGGETVASGNWSHAEGSKTTASRYYAHSEGYSTIASGEESHAEGYCSVAAGAESHAEGYKTQTLGSYSHAEGYQTATGYNGHAEGYLTTAISSGSHAEGQQTVAMSGYSHAEGLGDRVSVNLTGDANSLTYTCSGASGSLFEIPKNHGTTNYPTYGYISQEITSNSPGLLKLVRVTSLTYEPGPYGDYTVTSIGVEQTLSQEAITNKAFVLNIPNAVNSSHSEGYRTHAWGYYSHAEGYQTIATHKSQHIFGEYNIQDDSQATSSQRGNYVEIVGNGTSLTAKSNARTLDWNGNEVLAGKLTVGVGPTANMDVATKQYVDNSVAANTDTKNTAGSTDTSNKIFLIGAESQGANPQTYSDDQVYATNGQLDANKMRVAEAVTLQYNSTTKSLDFIFA